MLKGIEIDRLEGRQTPTNKQYTGTANGGELNIHVHYKQNMLELRTSRGGDPRTGIVVVAVPVADAPPFTIPDAQMVGVLEANGILFKGRQRIVVPG